MGQRRATRDERATDDSDAAREGRAPHGFTIVK